MVNIVLKGNYSSGKEGYLALLRERNMIPTDVNLYVDGTAGIVPDVTIYLYSHPEICYTRQNEHTREEVFDLQLKLELELDDLNCQIPIYKVNVLEHRLDVLHNLEDILRDCSGSGLHETATDEMTDN